MKSHAMTLASTRHRAKVDLPREIDLPRDVEVDTVLMVLMHHLTERGAAIMRSGEPWYVISTDGDSVFSWRVGLDSAVWIHEFPAEDRDLLLYLSGLPVRVVYFGLDGQVIDGWKVHEWEENS